LLKRQFNGFFFRLDNFHDLVHGDPLSARAG
jgi:hypothetical protein